MAHLTLSQAANQTLTELRGVPKYANTPKPAWRAYQPLWGLPAIHRHSIGVVAPTFNVETHLLRVKNEVRRLVTCGQASLGSAPL